MSASLLVLGPEDAQSDYGFPGPCFQWTRSSLHSTAMGRDREIAFRLECYLVLRLSHTANHLLLCKKLTV